MNFIFHWVTYIRDDKEILGYGTEGWISMAYVFLTRSPVGRGDDVFLGCTIYYKSLQFEKKIVYMFI